MLGNGILSDLSVKDYPRVRQHIRSIDRDREPVTKNIATIIDRVKP
jgi:hypothetical protein